MKKIDCHVHMRLFKGIPKKGSKLSYIMPEEVIQKYDKYNIEKGIILTGGGKRTSMSPQSNEEVMYIVEKYPDRFEWFCNLHPYLSDNTLETDFSYFIEYYKERGAKGVGEISFSLNINDKKLYNLLYHCEKCRMPIIIHLTDKDSNSYGLVDDIGLPGLEKILQTFPNLIVLGHSQAFWSEISSDVTKDNRCKYNKGSVTPGRVIELMRKYPNLHGDLCAGSGYNALSRDPEFGCKFIEEFSDRLYYGTDFTSVSVESSLSYWLEEMNQEGYLSTENYNKIIRNNCERILKREI